MRSTAKTVSTFRSASVQHNAETTYFTRWQIVDAVRLTSYDFWISECPEKEKKKRQKNEKNS